MCLHILQVVWIETKQRKNNWQGHFVKICSSVLRKAAYVECDALCVVLAQYCVSFYSLDKPKENLESLSMKISVSYRDAYVSYDTNGLMLEEWKILHHGIISICDHTDLEEKLWKTEVITLKFHW